MKRISMLSPLIMLLLQLLTACASGPGKAELDAEVKRLCAIDGGMRVYETVKLPAEKFDKRQHFINFYKPTQEENALGQEYLLKRSVYYYLKGNPEMSRQHYKVFRRSDGKLLGETILYGRGGGDLPGPWYESGFNCPTFAEAGVNALLKKLFVPSNDEE